AAGTAKFGSPLPGRNHGGPAAALPNSDLHRKLMRLRQTLAITLFTIAAAILLPAQAVDGSLRGLIVDPDDRSVGGAKVVLIQNDTALKRSVKTSAAGAYAFAALPPGVYRLEISADGFKTLTVEDFVLEVGDSARQDLELQLGSERTSVDVTAVRPLVD